MPRSCNRSTYVALGRDELHRCFWYLVFLGFVSIAQTAIKKDGRWLKGYHRKACAHQAMGERGVALETYRHALDIEPNNK